MTGSFQIKFSSQETADKLAISFLYFSFLPLIDWCELYYCDVISTSQCYSALFFARPCKATGMLMCPPPLRSNTDTEIQLLPSQRHITPKSGSRTCRVCVRRQNPHWRRRHKPKQIGNCCCEWECSHWMQATSKEMRAGLHACVQCELGRNLDSWLQCERRFVVCCFQNADISPAITSLGDRRQGDRSHLPSPNGFFKPRTEWLGGVGSGGESLFGVKIGNFSFQVWGPKLKSWNCACSCCHTHTHNQKTHTCTPPTCSLYTHTTPSHTHRHRHTHTNQHLRTQCSLRASATLPSPYQALQCTHTHTSPVTSTTYFVGNVGESGRHVV